MKAGGTQNTLAQNAKALVQDWIGTRKQVSLWLDLKVNKDYETLEIIQRMKSKREFRRSVMLGLKIVWELRRGQVDTLLSEFPQVKEWLQLKITNAPTPDDDGRLHKIEGLLEMVVANQQSNNGYTMASLPLTPSTGKQIAAPAFEIPTFDDDDDLPTLKLSTNTSINSAQNLVNCVFGLTH